MIFPDKRKRMVQIRRNHIDHRKEQQRHRRRKITVSILVVSLLLAGGIYARADLKVLEGIDYLKSLKKNTISPEERAAKKGATDADNAKEKQERKDNKTAKGTKDREKVKEEKDSPITVAFTGDVLLSDYVVNNYKEKGLDGVVTKDLRKILKGYDILTINNEFPYSTRGVKAADKQYTFRADPSYAKTITKKIGVDVATLANNHVLDYGKDALTDTFTALGDAKIPYTGAGESREEAKGLVTVKKNGKTFGFLAASRVIPLASWDIRNSQPGVFTCYDPSDLIEEIKKDKEKVDYLFVSVHWGQEHVTTLRDYETPMAHKILDAGADAVIGAHPHVLQKMEFYNGKPVFYSLGNFIFNRDIDQTVVAVASIDKKQDKISWKLLPAKAHKATTTVADPEEGRKILQYMDDLSDNVSVDTKGNITEKQ
ncbi:MAG: CapA family protein [Lachnospiraceae bacterium]|nr:CapA family protein [Lachnospiraceae bacterium]